MQLKEKKSGFSLFGRNKEKAKKGATAKAEEKKEQKKEKGKARHSNPTVSILSLASKEKTIEKEI